MNERTHEPSTSNNRMAKKDRSKNIHLVEDDNWMNRIFNRTLIKLLMDLKQLHSILIVVDGLVNKEEDLTTVVERRMQANTFF